MKNYLLVIGLVIILLSVSCGGGSDNGMIQNPNPDPNPVPSADFSVRAAAKTANHPWANMGHSVAYTINGNEAVTLRLIRGTKYTFDIKTPGHPFYISTDETGQGNGEVTNGVSGSRTESGTLTFTPNANHPDTLYYQCAIHSKMGYFIILSDS